MIKIRLAKLITLLLGGVSCFAITNPMPSLYDRSEYAIQLANPNVWEAKTGFNNLAYKIEVQL